MDIELINKLKMNERSNILVFDKPENFCEFEGLSFDTSGGKFPYDFIFSFIYSHDDMGNSIEEVYQKHLVTVGGYLYLAYPKALFTFILAKNSYYKDTSFRVIDSFELDQDFNVIGFYNVSVAPAIVFNHKELLL